MYVYEVFAFSFISRIDYIWMHGAEARNNSPLSMRSFASVAWTESARRSVKRTVLLLSENITDLPSEVTSTKKNKQLSTTEDHGFSAEGR